MDDLRNTLQPLGPIVPARQRGAGMTEYLLELVDLETTIDESGPFGFEGVENGKVVNYAYKSRSGVVHKLRVAGYLR